MNQTEAEDRITELEATVTGLEHRESLLEETISMLKSVIARKDQMLETGAEKINPMLTDLKRTVNSLYSHYNLLKAASIVGSPPPDTDEIPF